MLNKLLRAGVLFLILILSGCSSDHKPISDDYLFYRISKEEGFRFGRTIGNLEKCIIRGSCVAYFESEKFILIKKNNRSAQPYVLFEKDKVQEQYDRYDLALTVISQEKANTLLGGNQFIYLPD